MRKSKIKNSSLAESIAQNLKDVKEMVTEEIKSEVEPNSQQNTAHGLKHIRHYDNQQLSIIRQSSIKSAVSFMGVLLPRLEIRSADEVLAHTIAVAEEFERWVIRS